MLLLAILFAAGVFDGDPENSDLIANAETNKTQANENPAAPPANTIKTSATQPVVPGPTSPKNRPIKEPAPQQTTPPKTAFSPPKRPSRIKPPAVQPKEKAPLPMPLPPAVKPLDLAELTTLVQGSLVRIDIGEPKGLAGGSGFVIDRRGLIATNYHVIEKAKDASVLFADGRRSPVLGAVMTMPSSDLALLKVDTTDLDLKPLPLTPYGTGQGIPVAAFALDSDGKVKAQAGEIKSIHYPEDLQPKGFKYRSGKWIKTEIPISPDDSGGPIVNKLGDVVAVNSMPFPDDPNSAIGHDYVGLQIGLGSLASEVVPLVRLARDKRLAKFGLNEYMMTDDFQASVPAKTKQAVRQLMSNGSKPLKHYARKGGPRYVDQVKEWQQHLYESYHKMGSRDPAWDSYADRLLIPKVLSEAETEAVIQGVLATECDDAAFLMACASIMPPSSQAWQTMERAGKLLEASAYPPLIRQRLWKVYHRIAKSHAGGQDAAAEALKRIDRETVNVLRQPIPNDVDRRRIYHQLDLRDWLKHRPQNDAGVKQLLEAGEVDSWMREMVMGTYHDNIAWVARGDGYVDTVSERQWEIFKAHIEQARSHFLKAWELRPQLPEAAEKLMGITMSSRGIVGENERFWFEQAISAQWDYGPVYDSFYISMYPRWGGSHEMMLAFGMECLESNRFDTVVPSKFHRAVQNIVVDLESTGTTRPQSQGVYAKPEIMEAYRRMLKGYRDQESDLFPANYLDSQLACLLMLAGQREESIKVLDRLGDELEKKAFESFDVTYEYMLQRLSIVRSNPKPHSTEASAPATSLLNDPARVIEDSIGMKLAKIPNGEFQMGSTPNERQLATKLDPAYPPQFCIDESPRHLVRIAKSFYLGQHEVTRGQFSQFVNATGYQTEAERNGKAAIDSVNGANVGPAQKYTWKTPGFAQTDEHPVVNISWNDAVEFCEWLSRKEGVTYRLPTEAEWEYASKAGRSTLFQNGNDPEQLALVGNVADETFSLEKGKKQPSSPDKPGNGPSTAIRAKDGNAFTAPVGTYQANSFDLFDLHGNVLEWCADWYGPVYYQKSPDLAPNGPSTGEFRSIRGSAWNSTPGFCRFCNRTRQPPSFCDNKLGFRVVREIPQRK